MSNNPVRLQSGDGIPIAQTSNALDVNIASGSSGLPTGASTATLQTAGNASLASIDENLETNGITLLPLSADIDSIDVSKKSKGAVTDAHSAITATATSAEIDCRGFNSLLVAWISNATDKTWTIGLTGSMASGGTFVAHLDAAGAAIVYTTDISGWYVVTGIPDYVKIVATEVDDGATVRCSVQPFNV